MYRPNCGRRVVRYCLYTVVLVSSFALLAPPTLFAHSSTTYHEATYSFPGEAACAKELQHCIDAAPAGATIQIQSGVYTGSIVLTKAISLLGMDAQLTTLVATPGQRVLSISGSAVNNTVHIAGMTLTGGYASGNNGLDKHGGAILIEEGAQPQLSNLIIRDNRATGMGGGIAAVNTLHLTIQNSHFINNQAGTTGGGLCSGAEFTEISNSSFVENQATNGGGGLINGRFAMKGVTFDSNRASEAGGGLYAGKSNGERDAQAQLWETTFVRNQATTQGGGAFLFNSHVEDVRFEGNSVSTTTPSGISQGGGLATAGIMTVTRTTFADNLAQDGAGIVQMSGKLWASNLLFVDNQSSTVNGATALALLSADATARLSIMHVTIYAQVQSASPAIKSIIGTTRVTNSIIVNHDTGLHGAGARIIESNNLFHHTSPATSGDVTSSGSIHQVDPLFVDAAANNFHLSTGSPAIDAGIGVEITTDIDGEQRPTGSAPDIGYDEAMPVAIDPALLTNAVYLPAVVK